jgi:hypothetical protein
MQTLYMMLVHERWYEAKQIVGYEVKWFEDPAPPGIERGWLAVWDVLCDKCKERK